MEGRRFTPDPRLARRKGFVIAAVFIGSGAVAILGAKQTLALYIVGGLFAAFGLFALAMLIFKPVTGDRLSDVSVDSAGFTLHKPLAVDQRIAWVDVKAAWPYQQHLVVKIEGGDQVLVPLLAQPPAARQEILAAFRTGLGERFTSFLKQKV